jgi:hypothetical protein
MASGSKPSSARTHSTCSACRGLTTAPNRLGSAAHILPGRLQNATHVYAQCAHGAARSASGALSARSVARRAVARRLPNLGKRYTASFPSPR